MVSGQGKIKQRPILASKTENMENGVTVTLSKRNYNLQPFSLADTIRGGKEIRKALQKVPRVKAKMMVSKMKGKRWEPLFRTTSVDESVPYQHTFQLKPLNF